MPALVTIAIPTYNRCAVLMEGLRSLRYQTLGAFECFVVDNGPSTDGTSAAVTKLAADDQRFRYVPIGPVGCVVARNLAFRQAAAPILLTLDDDVELPDPSTLAYVVACFARDRRLGVLGLSEYFPSGKGKGAAVPRAAPHTWRAIWRDTTLYPPGKISRWGFIGARLYHLSFGQLHEVDHVRSSAMAIRRSAFVAAGGFFEPYTALGYGYRYETDLCVRVKQLGYKVVYAACAPQVYHKVSERQRGWDRSQRDDMFLYYTARNNTLFFLRNYWHGAGAAIFLIWDLLVGNSQQPGMLRFLRRRHGRMRGLRSALLGKVAGWRLYCRTVSAVG
jgi:GT2 family glycosyltransferase